MLLLSLLKLLYRKMPVHIFHRLRDNTKTARCAGVIARSKIERGYG